MTGPDVRRCSAWWMALSILAVIAPSIDARADASIEPSASHAVGRVVTAGTSPTGLTLLTAGGYGYTESVLGSGDRHHRVAGTLGAEARPLDWLGLGLRLDGRYDAHTAPGQPGDQGFVGDPRLYLRADSRGWGALRLGARAGLWLPGNDAPSLVAAAMSPEIVGVVSYVPASGPITVSLNGGYRLDRSARSAPRSADLSGGDRVALSLSAFDAALLGVVASVGRGRTQAFVEGSWELLVGSGAPPPLTSPMRVGLGGRFALDRRLRVEAAIEVSPSSRPDVGPMAALVPIPPRIAGWVGVSYSFGSSPPAGPPAVVASAPPPAPAPPAAPETAALRGQVSAADGGKLLELRVTVTAGDVAREAEVDDDGRFAFEGSPGQEVTVVAEATGYVTGSATARLATGTPAEVGIRLERETPHGQLRGLVRALKGGAVTAEIRVEPDGDGAGAPDRTAVLRTEAGRFQVDVPPGRYRVTISAPGCETQTRKVEVEMNGVTLLNVDLRSTR